MLSTERCKKIVLVLVIVIVIDAWHFAIVNTGTGNDTSDFKSRIPKLAIVFPVRIPPRHIKVWP